MTLTRARTLAVLLTVSAALFPILAANQYELEPAGAPPSELAPAIRAALQPTGARVASADSTFICEVWFRTTAPSGPPVTQRGVTLTTIPHGSLLGAIRFTTPAADRRGDPIEPGVYTLRLSYFPPDGNHQGVAPQRDFLLMSNAADDTDLNATPSFADLVKLSAKVTGSNHPAVLSVWKADPSQGTGFVQEGSDWVLYTKVGDITIGLILVGTFQ